MSATWRFFVDYQAWNDARRLFIRAPQRIEPGKSALVAPLTFVPVALGERYETPTLDESSEASQDGVGDVRGFLQGALDAAWEMGLRPTGFADHTNELKATRYHLEDMRALAKVPPREKAT